ncbi:hypothetical protein [Phenylobacterium sp.]|uniref:hypothetical protein n=1 Tax=Phenylobacterium sp. TaxID=1871053 RepID=UPI0035AFD155
MRILIFTDPRVGRRIREAASAEPGVTCAFAATGEEARSLFDGDKPQLLVLDAEIDFQTSAELARAAAQSAAVIFVRPGDAIVAEALGELRPFGFIDRGFDETELLHLISKARRAMPEPPAKKPWRFAGRPLTDVVGVGCALAAAAVGFRAPALFAALGRLPGEYLAAGALSLLSLSLLLRTQRTMAFAQLCAVTVITIAPTWR